LGGISFLYIFISICLIKKKNKNVYQDHGFVKVVFIASDGSALDLMEKVGDYSRAYLVEFHGISNEEDAIAVVKELCFPSIYSENEKLINEVVERCIGTSMTNLVLLAKCKSREQIQSMKIVYN
jgi:hypothetical protein